MAEMTGTQQHKQGVGGSNSSGNGGSQAQVHALALAYPFGPQIPFERGWPLGTSCPVALWLWPIEEAAGDFTNTEGFNQKFFSSLNSLRVAQARQSLEAKQESVCSSAETNKEDLSSYTEEEIANNLCLSCLENPMRCLYKLTVS